MQPQVVAQTLVKVEDEWKTEARAFAECNMTDAAWSAGCGGAPRRFKQSCATVLGAVVQASSGDRGIVQEYLDEICSQEQLQGWRSRICQSFSFSVTAAMTADVYENREDLDIPGVCHEFWQGLAEDEKMLLQQEREEQDAKKKQEASKAAEAAKEAAEEASKQAARSKVEAARQAERRRREEEAHGAEEAQKAAEEVEEEADEREREVDKTLAEAQNAIAETGSAEEQANATLASEKARAAAEKTARDTTAGAAGNATEAGRRN